MAVGDGTTWDETTPTDASLATTIDDYNRDVRKGVRSRMAFEHEWPASQSATNEAGKHKFITLQAQTGAPTLAGTQVASIYIGTDEVMRVDTPQATNIPNPWILQQVVYSTSGLIIATAGTMPNDDTIPQITEGAQLMTVNITPVSLTSALDIDVFANVAHNNGSSPIMCYALFQGTTANAIYAVADYLSVSLVSARNLKCTVTPSTTGSIAYSFRAGLNSYTSQVTLNGTDAGRKFGGVCTSFIKITERAV